jgi:hypothetical protein
LDGDDTPHDHASELLPDAVLSHLMVLVEPVVASPLAVASQPTRTGRRVVAATEPAAAVLERSQQELGEGPMVEASAGALVIECAPFDARWPGVVTALDRRAITTVWAMPLESVRVASGDRSRATVTIYGRGEAPPEEVARTAMASLATLTGSLIAVIDERDRYADEARHLHTALASRDVIGQAKGRLMSELGVDADEAFTLLRQESQRSNRKLTAVARQIVQPGATLADLWLGEANAS